MLDKDQRKLEKEKLEKMKQEYENIPVPHEAKARMEQGINQAKQERKVIKMKKWIRNTGTAAAAFLVVFTVSVNASPAFASTLENVPVLGAITNVVTFRSYEDKTNNFEADIQVPMVEGSGAEEVNRSIEEYAETLIAQYEKDLAEANGEGNYSLDSTYEVVSDTDQYVTIRINTTLVMASGTQFVKTFTVEKATGQVLSLNDLLADVPDYRQMISGNIKQQMEEQMEKDENVIYFHNSEMPEMDFQEITGEESYYLDGEGRLVIVFDEYEVAPGYMGAVEFTIPKDVVSVFSSPER